MNQKAIHRNSVVRVMILFVWFAQNSMVPCKVTGIDDVVDRPSSCVRVECSNTLSPLSLPSRSFFASLLLCLSSDLTSHLHFPLSHLITHSPLSLSSRLLSLSHLPFSLSSPLLSLSSRLSSPLLFLITPSDAYAPSSCRIYFGTYSPVAARTMTRTVIPQTSPLSHEQSSRQ
jgi:hypothetical protein